MWQVTNLRLDPTVTSWSVLRNGERWADFEFSLGGEYNVMNATAAAALASGCGIPKEKIASALKTFKSVKRRLEVRAQVNGITIIDDFAHHPTAIAGTLKALRCALSRARACGRFSSRDPILFGAMFFKMSLPAAWRWRMK